MNNVTNLRNVQETLVEYCLQALLSHSTVEEQCNQLVNALPLFNMVLQVNDQNIERKIKDKVI